ncbi:maleylacetate reductase [Mycobacterium sp. 21AC1]|uniref:maleylacetate reductase n=1 Tax=[Mycobacterium] appelbergii TaxID=2939269 RepID=UPI002939234F|nr:maleylacetate reductase [Mycobacterium sp. 21AC1]MDV3127537.1 maleylacetate reductase [Mycobacterium sp. 21AC1]
MSRTLRTFAHPAGVHNATPPRIVFGPGSSATLAEEIRRLKADRAMIVTTPGRASLGDEFATAVGDLCVGLLPEAVSQVPVEVTSRGVDKAASRGADCLVAIGGGAATGLCKGIAYDTGLPIIAVPTTYSGSEMTGYCGMTENGVKRMRQRLAMRPSTVIYDAELSQALPATISAASAMNALAHCVDAIYLPSLSPLLAPAAIEGARIIADTLPALVADPSNISLRNEMLYAAYLSGAALTGGYGLQHAVAHMLGGSYGVEHGTAHAVVLPYVTEQLVGSAPEAMARIADAIGTDDLPGTIWDLARNAGLPTGLDEVGFTPDDIERGVLIATTADAPPTDPDIHNANRAGNPAPVTAEVVRSVLQAASRGVRPGGPR